MKPVIAAPVKKTTEYKVPPCAEFLIQETGVCALELTVTPSSLTRARRFVRKLESEFKNLELRFHLVPRPEYDICAAGEIGEKAREKVASVVNFISEFASPAFLTVHSLAASDEESVEGVKELNKQALRKGVVISLENLASGWTSEPLRLLEFASATGVRLTIDIGHLNTSEAVRSGRYTRAAIVEMLGPFACAAHIYEHEENGHQAADDLLIMLDALHVLKLTSADWWVIELDEAGDFRKMFELVRSAV